MTRCGIAATPTPFWLICILHSITYVTRIHGYPLQDVSSATNQVTYDFGNASEEETNHVSDIIDALENLGVLDKSPAKCYTLERIVKNTTAHSEPGPPSTWRVSVSFFVKELANSEASDQSAAATSQSGNGEGSRDGETCIRVERKDNGAQSITDMGLGTGEGVGVGVNNSDTGDRNSTMAAVAGASLASDKMMPIPTEEHREAGLSRTQILVISTCSTVIGLFFIVALIMRIRNYLKRFRAGQSGRRSNFRSASVSIRPGSQLADEDGRESLPNSKVDPRLSGRTTAINPNDITDSPLTSTKCDNQENKPLLVVTSASAPSSPSFTQTTRGSYRQMANQSGEDLPLFSQDEEEYMATVYPDYCLGYSANYAIEYSPPLTSFQPCDYILDDIEERPEDEEELEEGDCGMANDAQSRDTSPCDLARLETVPETVSRDDDVEAGGDIVGTVLAIAEPVIQERLLEYPCDSVVVVDEQAQNAELCIDGVPVNNGQGLLCDRPIPDLEGPLMCTLIQGVGLSQSETSLNSCNNRHWYTYGNQEEYHSESVNFCEYDIMENIVMDIREDSANNNVAGGPVHAQTEHSYPAECNKSLSDFSDKQLDYSHNFGVKNEDELSTEPSITDDTAINGNDQLVVGFECDSNAHAPSDHVTTPRKKVTFSLDDTDNTELMSIKADDSGVCGNEVNNSRHKRTKYKDRSIDKNILSRPEFEGMEPTLV